MADDVVRVALKRGEATVSPHPLIKSVVQEQVGQQWRDDPSLWCPHVPRLEILVLPLPPHRRFEPSPAIEDDPWGHLVMLQCLDHQVVPHIVEEGTDVYLQYPTSLPAPFGALL